MNGRRLVIRMRLLIAVMAVACWGYQAIRAQAPSKDEAVAQTQDGTRSLKAEQTAATRTDVNAQEASRAASTQDQSRRVQTDQTTARNLTPEELLMRQQRITPLMRREAAARAAAARAAAAGAPAARRQTGQKLLAGGTAAPGVWNPGGMPDYFNIIPNYANSPLPSVVGTTITGGMRKFVDTLPGVGLPGCEVTNTCGKNNLGQYLPIATPDTKTFPGSDYYEISLVQYREQMHSDLPPVAGATGGTLLRGYVQTNNGTDAGGNNTIAPAPVHYLGPVVIAQRGRPVRVKFTNALPIGATGNLPIPVDTSYMGAGTGPDSGPTGAFPGELYTQNRATLHLHGGLTPWISDGTPHQWTVPSGDPSHYQRGASVAFVPDMWFDKTTHALIPGASLTPPTANATNDPGPGSLTFYYTNEQSARLMFYHDHAYGITRLNVYAGEAAGYLLTDPVEQAMISGGTIVYTPPGSTTPTSATFAAGTLPPDQIPLIIQDKTFVDAANIANEDPTWNWGSTPGTAVTGDLWFPHVYMTNQNPSDPGGANATGRWDYGLWFWPPLTANQLAHGPIPNPYFISTAATPTENPVIPGMGFNPSGTPESFLDTPVINGTAYPTVTVQPKPYRLRILNASNDRSMNLQMYFADTGSSGMGAKAVATVDKTLGTVTGLTLIAGGTGYGAFTNVLITGGGGSGATATATVAGGVITGLTLTNAGSGYTGPPVVTFFGGGVGGTGAAATAVVTAGSVTGFTGIVGGSGYNSAPNVYFIGGGGTGAAATATVVGGAVTALTVTNPGTGYTSAPVVMIGSLKEVKMVDACPDNGFPATWPTDGRDGGVPDPGTAGPPFVVYATEAGILPAPTTVNSAPVGYEYNRRSITVLNVFVKSLWLGPAERADVVVDFTNVPAGSTLIMYNDAPAPTPAFDPRLDYYTGDPDQSATGDPSVGGQTGGAPTTLPEYGPNTRTIMQINVAGAMGTAYNPAVLQAALPSAFAAAQPPPIVPEPIYNAAYGQNFTGTYARIQDTSLAFSNPINPVSQAVGSVTIAPGQGGSGYLTAPLVTIALPTAPGGIRATAVSYISGGKVVSIQVTNGGSGYTAPPLVTIGAPPVGGTQATATAVLGLPMLAKAIHELFELNYGRMNAVLGTELPLTNFNTQTTIPLAYIDPATEIFKDGDVQLWKITHNGVDTHAIHFHLVNVQLINRVGWDGAVKPPLPQEAGFLETVIMNPLEDVIIAVQPIKPVLPWKIGDSVRPLDTTAPLNSTGQFTGIDPFTNNPITVFNVSTNFGWEYVWHCHLLGHEENDMMRPIIFQVSPAPARNLTATAQSATSVLLQWSYTASSLAATNFFIQRATNNTFTAGLTTFSVPGANITSFTDTTAVAATTYYYRVRAENVSAYSAWTNTASATTLGPPPAAPTNLVAQQIGTTFVVLRWTDNSNNEQGFRLQQLIAGVWTTIFTSAPNVTLRTVTGLTTGTAYQFRVQAFNASGSSAFATLTVTTQ